MIASCDDDDADVPQERAMAPLEPQDRSAILAALAHLWPAGEFRDPDLRRTIRALIRPDNWRKTSRVAQARRGSEPAAHQLSRFY
jgi:hypothetical protein